MLVYIYTYSGAPYHGLTLSMDDYWVYIMFQDTSAQLSHQLEAVGTGRIVQSDSTSRVKATFSSHFINYFF